MYHNNHGTFCIYYLYIHLLTYTSHMSVVTIKIYTSITSIIVINHIQRALHTPAFSLYRTFRLSFHKAKDGEGKTDDQPGSKHCSDVQCGSHITQKQLALKTSLHNDINKKQKKHRDTSSLIMVAHHQISKAASSKANVVFKQKN